MASPVRSSGQLPPRSLRFGKEASTAKGSTSRLTPVQLAKVAREECEKLMGSVSSVYSPAELERAKQMKAREYEARPDQLPPDDPQRPPLPANNAPLEDFHRLRLLDGLEGVLNKDRGKIDAWLNRLQTKERQEQLSDLDEWFENFREREPELAKFLRDCESEVEQGRILCQRSENLVNKLSEDAVHTRHEVEAFVGRKLKPMAGAGEGGMVHAVERKRRLAQIHHDEAHLAKRVLDEMMQEREEALVQAKKDFYDQRLSRMRMQQAEQDEIQQLQSNIDERQEELTKLNEDVEQKAQVVRDMDSFVKFARKCLKDGRPIESKDPELDQLVEKYRDYALNRKRHIRTVACKRIDELEKQTQENRAAIAILNDGTIEANAEATTKENVVELVSHKQTAAKDVSQPADHGDRLQDDSRKQQSKMRNELIQTMKNIQFERGRADHAAKQTKVIQEATRNCESARAAVRRQLRRGIAKIMQSLHEEEQKLRPLVSMPQLLPSTWHTQLQHEWLREVKPFAELYAYMMFSSRLAPLQDEKDEGGRKGRKTVGKAEFASKIAADAEAIGRDLISLERKLTPAGVAAEQADLLAEAGLDDLDEPWLEEEQANKQRLASLRSMQQEMFEQARQVAIDLTPDAYLLEGINITEILGKDSNRSPRRNLVKKASTKRLM